MRQLTAMGYEPSPEAGRIATSQFVQLHTLSNGDDDYINHMTVVPLRHPYDSFRTMYGRGMEVEEIVQHFRRLLFLLAATRDCAFLNIKSKAFVDELAIVCAAFTPETIDLSPANFTMPNHDRLARIKKGEAYLHTVDFAVEWYHLVSS